MRSFRDSYRGLGLGVTISLAAESILIWQLASLAKAGPPAADYGDVFDCVFSRELVHVLLLGANDGGDPHRSVPRIGNGHRQVFSSSLCRRSAAFGLTPLGLKSARLDI
jgi:hypothetical protein